jgi:hypothetical protein
MLGGIPVHNSVSGRILCPADPKKSAFSKTMKIVTQLSVFLVNEPGTLADVCDALAAADINIYALTISDTVDHAVVRMVVSDTTRALHLFGERNVLVVENEVLMIDNNNQPGSLSQIANRLGDNGINIEYAYLSSTPGYEKGLLILRVREAQKALDVLKDLSL